MLLRIDLRSGQPLADQIAAGVRRQVADGTVTVGEALPTARDLAASLGVNMHTVLRAYAALRDEGILELRRRRGAVITAGPAVARVGELVAALCREARHSGMTLTELTQRIHQEWT
jgi:GntR family transcriptional regulator